MIREAIARAMLAHGWSQSELARRSGVSQQKISAYLGGRGLSNGNVEKLLKVLGISVAQSANPATES